MDKQTDRPIDQRTSEITINKIKGKWTNRLTDRKACLPKKKCNNHREN